MERAIRKNIRVAKVNKFIKIIYEILEEPDLKEVISWGQDWKNFSIKQIEEFSNTILPKYQTQQSKIVHSITEFIWIHEGFKRQKLFVLLA